MENTESMLALIGSQTLGSLRGWVQAGIHSFTTSFTWCLFLAGANHLPNYQGYTKVKTRPSPKSLGAFPRFLSTPKGTLGLVSWPQLQ